VPVTRHAFPNHGALEQVQGANSVVVPLRL
jgi:hypothetical protein